MTSILCKAILFDMDGTFISIIAAVIVGMIVFFLMGQRPALDGWVAFWMQGELIHTEFNKDILSMTYLRLFQ
ncbi:MAG: hypothetical protein B7Y39_09480 [Bdellovibrio sp. 28-41-41]|nr:MAG: hypothetical protein B7Y39_09480 [Bdellovibrio sp. 28-41-41]